MATRHRILWFLFPSFLWLLSVFICVHLWILSPSAFAQDAGDQEVAVNLAEGRVVICAAKDGIILAAMDAHGEAGSLPPDIAILSAERMGVMLGAVEWVQPDSKDKLAVLERLRELAGLLHHKINLGEDEPLIRIVLVGHVHDYGPEAWTIDYHIRQDALGNDIWRTRVLRPSYNQLYPPEKGQPKTFIEVRYPPENRATGEPELLDLLQQNDLRLTKIRAANEIEAKSVTLAVEGQSQKTDAASLVIFLKAALPATAASGTKLTMAKVDYDAGFQWILQPPKAPAPPPGEAPKEKTPEEPERPTLRHKSEN
jgi:hypothetical protein